jgi:hypothetical protein
VRHACNMLQNLKGTGHLGDMHGREDNSKTDLTEIRCEGVDWCQLRITSSMNTATKILGFHEFRDCISS